MNKPLNQANSSKSWLSLQTIVLLAIAWSVLALLSALFFSLPVADAEGVFRRSEGYIISTYIFQSVAYLAAAILCFRNLLSPSIMSGRSLWLGVGFGMLSYLLGNLILAYWELILKQEATNVSPADLFFIATYLFIGGGMVSALTGRRLNLERWQWGLVGVIALVGISLGIWVSTSGNPTTSADVTNVPGWAAVLEESVSLFYTVADVLLLIIATMLLLTFWGGRFSQSWLAIALAVFSLYIGDVWFSYAQNHIENYQSGALLEVFWVFSGVLFAISAALEYEISSRSRREKRGRRRA
ncbi:hypothetical protein [Aliterella atlantica]|uniref:Uncharacterized protein n=1 Tax=Aliterella atlantica CENA595 TaxID=1618023 RepID=A0A0D8ZSQ9_9CYAN|nr:hypothetical protein [Aliterella atlantica]KJH71770.1 hypothetical protein UH38_10265 [Aliterella atlantica CENA595]